VRVVTETGFLGLVAFLFLIITLLKRAYSTLESAEDPFQEGIAIGFLAGFIGLLFHALGANTFIIVRIMEPFWFITAVVVSISGLKEDNASGIDHQSA
jgi:O-antigen ligase